MCTFNLRTLYYFSSLVTKDIKVLIASIYKVFYTCITESSLCEVNHYFTTFLSSSKHCPVRNIFKSWCKSFSVRATQRMIYLFSSEGLDQILSHTSFLWSGIIVQQIKTLLSRFEWCVAAVSVFTFSIELTVLPFEKSQN